jgi:hypothetical protein
MTNFSHWKLQAPVLESFKAKGLHSGYWLILVPAMIKDSKCTKTVWTTVVSNNSNNGEKMIKIKNLIKDRISFKWHLAAIINLNSLSRKRAMETKYTQLCLPIAIFGRKASPLRNLESRDQRSWLSYLVVTIWFRVQDPKINRSVKLVYSKLLQVLCTPRFTKVLHRFQSWYMVFHSISNLPTFSHSRSLCVLSAMLANSSPASSQLLISRQTLSASLVLPTCASSCNRMKIINALDRSTFTTKIKLAQFRTTHRVSFSSDEQVLRCKLFLYTLQ